ncbi:hypothetical protein [Candidatus Nitrospira neomarina]|uniref:Bacterial Death-like domain-containing protein n=1 Tax=Candidatus Nitrospira neomarina TaxID=3020899 RepID=A0AA96JYT9_9BACT|nr:hypothetical protein [Candidatus Nitrospira neomarina]WNM60481.1 hypothetical protein PQG83_11980 [Candidatus Nitrospira neomarina]
MKNLVNISGGDNPERCADVVFVHGLDGDARTTWHPKESPDKFWPAWLGEDFPAIGIWSLWYAVSSSAWKGTTMPLIDRATNTLDLFELDDIGHRPVAFICHSLGGLLVKQALRLAAESRNPAWRAIAEHVGLIVFLSTPHSGADMASWIQYLGKLLRTTVTVEELEAHHPRLRELNDWYRDNVESLGIETFVYCEKLPTAGILVVNETTANPGIAGVRPIPVDEDHVSICKPSSREAQIYRRVKRLIETNLLNRGVSESATTQTTHDNRHRNRSPEQGLPFSGKAKIEFGRRMTSDWPELADYFEIPTADRARFKRGREPHGVWEWLEARSRLRNLPEALRDIGRDDLLEEFFDHPQ